MKIFTSAQIREIDKYTIENEPIASIDLMERAAGAITEWIITHYEQSYSFAIFAGPGNNGGDALAVARMLALRYYRISVYMVRFSNRLSPDAQTNLNRLQSINSLEIFELKDGDPFPGIEGNAIILDGIFGSGLSRPASGYAADVIQYLNKQPNHKIAIDIPSGLFGEDNTGNDPSNIFRADQTLALQFPSLSFFFAENEQFAGEWHVLPIGLHPEAIAAAKTQYWISDKDYLKNFIRKRYKFSHKGTYGHVLLIAGCYGMMGAAVLAARASLRAGSGLVTVHVPRLGYQIVQTALPEALISIDQSDLIFSDFPDLEPFTAVGIGPGLGCKPNSGKGLKNLIDQVKVPLVIDADALNMLSENKEWLQHLRADTILTPHPKEFERLTESASSGFDRHLKQINFAKKYRVIVVLKGAYTSIALPDGRCFFNASGNPGLATAGSGDVLTGIILSLLGQGYKPEIAGILGVFTHGFAGDIASNEKSEEAVIAGDITDCLGKAFQKIKE